MLDSINGVLKPEKSEVKGCIRNNIKVSAKYIKREKFIIKSDRKSSLYKYNYRCNIRKLFIFLSKKIFANIHCKLSQYKFITAD